MTPQEIFDTVARHLFTQGERAGIQISDDPEASHAFDCLYRAPGGKSCAVGCLIPDADYDPIMEDKMIDTLCSAYPDRLPKWMPDNVHLLEWLQGVHDAPANWKDDTAMKFALGLTADKFGLDKSILDTLSFNRVEA